MKKKRRVPDVLWRLYGNRACTLADTIVSLLPLPPPSPADCWCKGCGCLGCSGDGAMSFLLRSDDPPDYHKLLNRCFVVMPDDQLQRRRAFYPECRWSQLTMVRRTIEMIMCESRQPSNLICSGYNKAIGHGIPSSFFDELHNVAKEFFDLPTEEKLKYAGVDGSINSYGTDSIISDNQVFNWSDRLYLLVRPEHQRSLRYWPDNLVRFRCFY
ncbi:hypothetical protein NE237_005293 [Protea cynaroides]|uniref:Telomerase reverse transcriptase n=1 Tax=Protea cynaroides TaxID=273540 RepID=A0A9Q0QUH5_9MAGN|nr:hypothetical protein NE237_005293 [Protea cynaroides]